jgi:hypothetical protein
MPYSVLHCLLTSQSTPKSIISNLCTILLQVVLDTSNPDSDAEAGTEKPKFSAEEILRIRGLLGVAQQRWSTLFHEMVENVLAQAKQSAEDNEGEVQIEDRETQKIEQLLLSLTIVRRVYLSKYVQFILSTCRTLRKRRSLRPQLGKKRQIYFWLRPVRMSGFALWPSETF